MKERNRVPTEVDIDLYYHSILENLRFYSNSVVTGNTLPPIIIFNFCSLALAACSTVSAQRNNGPLPLLFQQKYWRVVISEQWEGGSGNCALPHGMWGQKRVCRSQTPITVGAELWIIYSEKNICWKPVDLFKRLSVSRSLPNVRGRNKMGRKRFYLMILVVSEA